MGQSPAWFITQFMIWPLLTPQLQQLTCPPCSSPDQSLLISQMSQNFSVSKPFPLLVLLLAMPFTSQPIPPYSSGVSCYVTSLKPSRISLSPPVSSAKLPWLPGPTACVAFTEVCRGPCVLFLILQTQHLAQSWGSRMCVDRLFVTIADPVRGVLLSLVTEKESVVEKGVRSRTQLPP